MLAKFTMTFDKHCNFFVIFVSYYEMRSWVMKKLFLQGRTAFLRRFLCTFAIVGITRQHLVCEASLRIHYELFCNDPSTQTTDSMTLLTCPMGSVGEIQSITALSDIIINEQFLL